jgi:hypothetical protein
MAVATRALKSTRILQEALTLFSPEPHTRLPDWAYRWPVASALAACSGWRKQSSSAFHDSARELPLALA